jgi:predicted enzyme related to lactoylglutathione lyase
MPDTIAGMISWIDLTVANADEVKAFYQRVAGWTSQPVDMGGYDDFNMLPAGAQRPVAGICHARGPNTGLPAQWMIYITVANLDSSLDLCKESGGGSIDAG